MVMDIMKKTIRNEVIIGNAHLLDLEVLVPDRPARLLAMGNLARNRAPASDNPKVESLSAINYLVVGAGGDIYQMMEAVSRIKEKNPRLKVILADSLETPMFPTNQENKPAGVERIIYASKKMSDASRGLLYHKAGILTGCGGSLACGVAFTLADKIGTAATVAFTITNFDLNILDQLQQ
eukprot:TRINITY_DN591_c0_g1_i1.p1 TRINITY_DN591_c0_g1~~TRINITY_DN591_c0_g1_i1.p1  ORF type:complete len:180 (-),score=41.26 TRINITY_DN591_c0_g1_i1:247-786(-)